MIALKLIFLQFRRHPFGALFIVLLIAATTALSVAVSLQERALREGSARAADQFDLIIGAPGSETQLVLSTVFLQAAPLALIPADTLNAIAHNPLTEWASPVGFGDYYRGHPLVGVNRELLSLGGKRQPAQGRFFQHTNEAVVGARSGLKIGDHFAPVHGQLGDDQAGSHEAFTYTVVGLLPEDGSVWDQAVLVPIEAIWLMHEHGEPAHTFAQPLGEMPMQGAPAMIVKPKSVAGAYQLRQQYRGHGTQAVFPGEVLVKLYATLGDAKTLLSIIAFATQLLVGLAVTVILSIYLQQQRGQTAALRVFGVPRSRLFVLLWSGLVVMIAAAITLGVAVGYLIARIASDAIAARNGFVLPVHLTGEDAGFIAALAGISALALLIPAILQLRQSPAEVLRQG